MFRPSSIHRFENAWWGATALWLVGTLLAWNRISASLAGDPRTAAAANLAQPLIVSLVLALTVLLWWLAARRASPVGKWLVVVSAAASVLVGLGRLLSLASGRSLHPLSLVAFLLGMVLTIVAAAALFRPDADEWFGLAGPEPLP